ncbi:Clr6 histone deacetylase associated PHD protein-2 Cph2 [Ceratocystis pirilliformis]|uniref:Clr6 histone deacetylase associated PHD protein-2 Cph2 n=1 Tax=Ceratocystis pirilliformis TaxID=259994 RepID=A0ABR3YMP5_9PEZI
MADSEHHRSSNSLAGAGADGISSGVGLSLGSGAHTGTHPSEDDPFGPVFSPSSSGPGINATVSNIGAGAGAGASDTLYSPVTRDLHPSPFPPSESSVAEGLTHSRSNSHTNIQVQAQVQAQTQPLRDHAQVQAQVQAQAQAQARHHLSSHAHPQHQHQHHQHQQQQQQQQQQQPQQPLQLAHATQPQGQLQSQDQSSALGHGHLQIQRQANHLLHEAIISDPGVSSSATASASASALKSSPVDSPLDNSSNNKSSQTQLQAQQQPQRQQPQPQAQPYHFNNINLSLSNWQQTAAPPAFNTSSPTPGPILSATSISSPANATAYPSAWDLSVLSPQEQNLHLQQLQLQQLQSLFPYSQSAAPAAFQQPISSGLDAISPEAVEKLTPAQLDRLKSIKMPPPHLRYHSPAGMSTPGVLGTTDESYGNTSMEVDFAQSSTAITNKKRKVSAEDEDEDDEEEDGGPVKKTAHNMIEKRYRTNLNDKIAFLRDSVPSLRIMSKSARGEDTTEDREELHGLTPAHKLNKATVLSKATEYIRHLEKRNNRLIDENLAMQRRIQAFEKLFMAGAMSGTLGPLPPNLMSMQYAAAAAQTPGPSQFMSPEVDMESSQPPDTPAVGMIPVPDDMKRLIETQMQGQPYPMPPQQFASPLGSRQQTIQQQQQMQQARYQNGGRNFGKLMVGSLAGLMVLEALREDDQSTEQPEGRGLSGLPTYIANSALPRLHFSMLGYPMSTSKILLMAKLVLVAGIFIYVLAPIISARLARGPKKLAESVRRMNPLVESSECAREQSWKYITSKVWFPTCGNPVLGMLVLFIKAVEAGIYLFLGPHNYQRLFGRSDDAEAERIRAWSEVIDFQLSGHDEAVSSQRLLFTLLSSTTLPKSPTRLMRKAVHMKIAAQSIGGVIEIPFITSFVSRLCRSCWNDARYLHYALERLQSIYSDNTIDFDNELPQQLALLLEQEYDDVLTHDVIGRAINHIWSTTGPLSCNMSSCLPLDLVASWWSEMLVNQALLQSLNTKGTRSSTTQAEVNADLDLALGASPAGSVIEARAVVAHALLAERNRSEHISYAIKLLNRSSFEISAANDLNVSLRCTIALESLSRANAIDKPISLPIYTGHSRISWLSSLLSCVATCRLIEALFQSSVMARSHRDMVESMSKDLRQWIGGGQGKTSGMNAQLRLDLISWSLGISKSMAYLRENSAHSVAETKSQSQVKAEEVVV